MVLCPPDAIAERLDALRAGVDEALADTIEPSELAARLAILEDRARARHETVLAITDDTSMDLVAHEVRRAGRLVHLRPKEFQLLAMLAAHPGRAYTRRQLWTASGERTTTATPARWTSTSAGCGASSRAAA